VLAYVHFPYCLKKCPYCDFASYAKPRLDIDHAGYADAVIAELALRAPPKDGFEAELTSVFFGGGTPSLWDASELGRVLAQVKGAFRAVARDLEVTVECNPTSLDEAHASALLEQGVNRLSVGVQSLDASRLGFLGRLHDAEGGLSALVAARRGGFERVSADLIFGVQGGEPETPAHAAAEVDRVASMGITHVSAYGLTIEPGTQFGELSRKGRLPIATDDTIVESFFAIEDALAQHGLSHYEISNYAKPGEEARHNLGYWQGVDYVGLGCSAVGTLTQPALDAGGPKHAVRYKNHPDPGRYTRGALAGALALSETETLDAEALLRERIMLGLRLRVGIDLEQAGRDLGVLALTSERSTTIDRLVERGQIERVGERIAVTPGARALTDGIAAQLF